MKTWLANAIDPEVHMWVAYECQVLYEADHPGEWIPGDLNSKANRLFAEAAAVAETRFFAADHIECLNKAAIT